MTSYYHTFNKRQIEQIVASIYILIMAILISGFWSPLLDVKVLACLGPPSYRCLMLPTWTWALTVASITIVIGTSALTILGYWAITKLKDSAIDREREKLAKDGFFD